MMCISKKIVTVLCVVPLMLAGCGEGNEDTEASGDDAGVDDDNTSDDKVDGTGTPTPDETVEQETTAPTDGSESASSRDSAPESDSDTDSDTDSDSDTDNDDDGDTDTDSDSGSTTSDDVATDTAVEDTTGSDSPSDTSNVDPPQDTELNLPLLEPEKIELAEVQTCESVWDIIKEQFIQDMTEQVLAQRDLILENKATSVDDCPHYYYRGETDYAYDDDYDVGANDTSEESEPDPSDTGDADGEGGAKEYSTTNTQVEGVDEADFYKNDGENIFILADGQFQIIDAWPAPDAFKISSTPIEGEPKKLYIYGNIALIYSSLGPVVTTDPTFLNYTSYGASECTYGYDCDFVGDGQIMKITVLDITDYQAPKVIRETVMNGSYLNSRRINSSVYTVVVFPELMSRVDGLEYFPTILSSARYQCGEDIEWTEEQIVDLFDALITYNTAIINAVDFTGSLPTITDTQYQDGSPVSTETLLEDCSNFYVSQTQDGANMIMVAGMDMETLGEYNMAAIVAKPGAVYADSDSLYLAVRHYQSHMHEWFYDASVNATEATGIHKFNLDTDTAGIAYQGSGLVKGRILNQFSMDEHQEHLRIATTMGRVPSPDVHSTLSVLAAETGDLTITGQIDDIAPTEDIRSARFNGDVGYIVTFKKTDPLFVFDLSDPTAPATKGELKIPGYSTYMHMMDDAHILSIGYDAEDHDSFAYFQGIQLQILDVTELSNPLLIHKEVIGTRGSTSDAATNHLAFNYFKTQDRLAIPMVVCEDSGGGGSYGDMMTFSGLMVYDVTVENGFNFLGGIPHEEAETEENYRSACSNWWTRSNSKVKRSIFMDDYVYSIALDLINISHIEALPNPVSSIPLEQPVAVDTDTAIDSVSY